MAPLAVAASGAEAPYLREGIAGARPVPYTVRNTFVDLAPQAEESPSEGIFSTWPLRAAPEAAAQESEEAPRGPAAAPDREQELPSREEGEILEEGDEELEEGELLEESEEGEEDDVPNSTPVPPRDPGASPDAWQPAMSLGSQRHHEGACRPCAWLYKSASGCWHGEKCEYCHLCPPGEIKRRKRDKAKSVAEAEQRLRQRTLAASSLPLLSGAALAGRADGGGLLAAPLRDVLAMEPCYVEVTSPSPVGFASTQPRGSLGHAVGQCRPCAWVHKDVGGCKNGDRCKYCHLCPPGELKRRKRQKKWSQALEQNPADLDFQGLPGGFGYAERCYQVA